MSDWQDEEVRNEVRSRDRNEWIEDVRGSNGDAAAAEVYLCECGDRDCSQRILLTRPEYEAVRGYATRFALARDHENPEVDQLVSEGGRYTVVEKMAGSPARIARETYRRGGGIGS
jgi:hypothetical protein